MCCQGCKWCYRVGFLTLFGVGVCMRSRFGVGVGGGGRGLGVVVVEAGWCVSRIDKLPFVPLSVQRNSW